MKKCDKCGFAQNPDDAHYCGACGQRLPGEGDWRLYNSTGYTVVKDILLASLRSAADRASKMSVQNGQMVSESKALSDKVDALNQEVAQLKSRVATLTRERDTARKDASALRPYKRMYYDLERRHNANSIDAKLKKFLGSDAFIGAILAIVVAVIGWLGFKYWPASCSSPKFAVVEVDGKYGLGTDADNLVLPAVYDSISPWEIGDQHMVYSFADNKLGLVYADRDTVGVVDPTADKVYLFANGIAAVFYGADGSDYESVKIARKGGFRSTQTYKNLWWLVENNKVKVFVAKSNDGTCDILDSNAIQITFARYANIYQPALTLLQAYPYHGSQQCQLYDGEGKKIGSMQPMVTGFSEGVAWSAKTMDDYNAGRYTLIDTLAKPILTLDGVQKAWGFSQGIAFVKIGNRITAIDKTGQHLFDVDNRIEEFGPAFVNGNIGVLRRNGAKLYVGLMDKNGRLTAPMDYELRGTLDDFKKGFLKVRRNGRVGILGYDGEFK